MKTSIASVKASQTKAGRGPDIVLKTMQAPQRGAQLGPSCSVKCASKWNFNTEIKAITYFRNLKS